MGNHSSEPRKKPVFCNLSKQPKSLAETKNTHNGCSNGQKNCGSIAIAAIACFKKYLLLPATEKRKMAFLKSRRRNEVGRKLYLKRLITNLFFPCFLFIQSQFIILHLPELYKVQKVQFKFSSGHWTQRSIQVQFIGQKLNLNCCSTHHWTFLNWVESQFRERGGPPCGKEEELGFFHVITHKIL